MIDARVVDRLAVQVQRAGGIDSGRVEGGVAAGAVGYADAVAGAEAPGDRAAEAAASLEGEGIAGGIVLASQVLEALEGELADGARIRAGDGPFERAVVAPHDGVAATAAAEPVDAREGREHRGTAHIDRFIRQAQGDGAAQRLQIDPVDRLRHAGILCRAAFDQAADRAPGEEREVVALGSAHEVLDPAELLATECPAAIRIDRPGVVQRRRDHRIVAITAEHPARYRTCSIEGKDVVAGAALQDLDSREDRPAPHETRPCPADDPFDVAIHALQGIVGTVRIDRHADSE